MCQGKGQCSCVDESVVNMYTCNMLRNMNGAYLLLCSSNFAALGTCHSLPGSGVQALSGNVIRIRPEMIGAVPPNRQIHTFSLPQQVALSDLIT
jgi:hypothetical protein